MQKKVDILVLGGGTAGCVLANRLSASSNRQVTLLEAGGKDSYIWLKIPVGYLYCIGNPRTDWLYRTEPEAGLNQRSLSYPRGRVMGGCSSINGMIYMRGQAADYDHWQSLGNPGWGWDSVLPLFKISEDEANGADEWHGSGGELRVESQRLHWQILDAFRDAAVQSGIPAIDDFNRGDNHGVAYFRVNQKRGLRWNGVRGFIRPIQKRQNLEIMTHCLIDRIEIKDHRAVGVWYRDLNGFEHYIAATHIILTAGAIGSPAILQRSGIGDGNDLQGLGIDLNHHAPSVGQNLQDHLQLRAIYRVKNVPTLNIRAKGWLGKVGIALEYGLKQSGPMAMAPSQLGIFAKSDSQQPRANLQYHVQPLSLEKFGEGLHDFPAITASVCHLQPESRGTVMIRDRNPESAPAIKPNYLSTLSDQETAVKAIELTRRIVAQPALAAYEPSEWRPGAHVTAHGELVKAAGDIGTTIFHPVGTCRMGADAGAVVDSSLKVKGVENLWIADASIMPRITSGNTNAPTVMIAEKFCREFLKGYG
ncbi:MAG: GMC family oxidoreductase [Candidatus Pacebacteria bacterium]|nr:GMC family oxidoreductase [Candidatus Paceibacterota bacterium]